MSRTALVTGGNRGLGLEVCRQLARADWRVLLTSRGSEGEAAAAQLKRDGLQVEYRPLDVTDEASARALADKLSSEPLDLLVNNAGVALGGVDGAKTRRTLAVNFLGPLRLIDALLPRLKDGAAVVMVSSGMGELTCVGPELRAKLSDPKLTRAQVVALMESFAVDAEKGSWVQSGWPSSAYRASKAGLNALTRVLARELLPRKIRVNAVCPGWVRTDMGGPGAPRSVEDGAKSIVATGLDPERTGGFFRDGQPIPW